MNKGYEKVLKNKKLDKECSVKVTYNEMGDRIFVQFSSNDGKLVLQKSFQGNYFGKKESEAFLEQIKGINDLRSYFGINKSVKESK